MKPSPFLRKKLDSLQWQNTEAWWDVEASTPLRDEQQLWKNIERREESPPHRLTCLRTWTKSPYLKGRNKSMRPTSKKNLSPLGPWPSLPCQNFTREQQSANLPCPGAYADDHWRRNLWSPQTYQQRVRKRRHSSKGRKEIRKKRSLWRRRYCSPDVGANVHWTLELTFTGCRSKQI